MEKTYYPEMDETVYRQTLPNGLPVVVVHRPGFTKTLAYFVTDYGAIHTHYTHDGVSYRAPEGVAHYLEHKLFDMPGRDVMAEFAALGASPNAFTSYDLTAYYFSCTQNFPEALKLLLEFVSTPYFTKESVQKEQGIIGQEIDMNLDNPDTRVFENLMKGMYRNHPIVHPILGDRQTIAQITPQVLQQCHRAFYHSGNMLLCVVGDVDAAQVCHIAAQTLPQEAVSGGKATRQWQESMTCPQSFVSDTMDVAMPMFQLGFKCEPTPNGEDGIRQEMVGDLAAEALFGESSSLYLDLYRQGLIDSAFGGGFETVEGMAMLSASGDSNDPQAVLDAILRRAEELAVQGIPQEDFLRMKRSCLGRRIRSLDSFDATCFRVCAYHFSQFDYFRYPGVYRQVEDTEIQEFLRRVVTRDRCCLSVIYPPKQEVEENAE